MTEKELKKLKREDLLKILVEQAKKIETLEEKLKNAEDALYDRKIMLEEAGTIAEASLKINKVFQTVQQAADQYLENIILLNSRMEEKAAAKTGNNKTEEE